MEKSNYKKHCPSAFGKKYEMFMRKSMTKKAYREHCKSFRCLFAIGRNYGTRTMVSKKEREKYKTLIPEEC